MKRSTKWILWLSPVLIVALVVVGVRHHFQSRYPYGSSHCCIKGMMFALEAYADSHQGNYPGGEETPEASLSLLYTDGRVDPYTLRGKTVPEPVVREILESGGLLGPDTCGWHYAPGLTSSDNPRLALLYSKEPLDHNGGLTDGGREVVFVGGNIGWVSGKGWEKFLADQRILLAARTDRDRLGLPSLTLEIELPDGRRITELEDGFLDIAERSSGPDSSMSFGGRERFRSSYSIGGQNPGELKTVTFTFKSLEWTADPVTVTFTNRVPSATSVVFKARPWP